jgi:hypothetical protein
MSNSGAKRLNKWFRAKQLSLNFNKTNYVHFITKINMSVNFKIGFNNNLITDSSYTKFLGLTMGSTFSWNNHIDLLMKKISTVCYIIINAKTYISASSFKMIYYSFFHSAMSYELYFGESHRIVPQFLTCKKKKAIRIMEGCGNRVSCTNVFKKLQILPLTSQYILSLLMFVFQNKNLTSTNI